VDPRWDVLGIGTAAVDDLLAVERFPQPDEKMPVLSVLRQGGGQTATALVAAARHGARAAYCASLGDDELSRYTLQALEREGVDCSTVIHAPGSRPVHSVVIVDAGAGTRTILHDSSGMRDPDPGDIDPGWIAASRLVFVDQNVPRAALYAARLARAAGVPVAADLESPTMPGLAELLPLVDHLIVGIGFARRVTGQERVEDALAALADPARAAAVVTWGSRGCWYSLAGGDPIHLPAIPTQAVDTTGCGDVFHGVYAAAITRGEHPARAARLANAAAGLKAAYPGGRAGIPSLEVVERCLSEEPPGSVFTGGQRLG
jgi:ribokinase